ncbi:hypothetical protein [Halalkalibacter akibai]|uniref:Uncharacterized protein n=1 Tax=Halalkalibacter akibai (strain ATCC 43226 / DSM 21942 / CIP 109018 / JCM 9157 / 1139) TaxID=1236973 RepID=W4QPX1_HALA3|nr:hypothetical protein [Halalkalibacter akibai]GAE33394.1 hypothetical protein JCM9157_392 [Halalkalibacter akibai JCM 9157]
MSIEQLFDFIAQNFIFVAVIIGGIISMLGRLSGAGQGQQEQGGQRTNQQPRRQQEEQVDWREIFKQEERETSKPIETQQEVYFEDPTVSRQQELQTQYEEMQRKREKSSRKVKELRKTTSQNEVYEKRGLDLQLSQLSNREAMKGVVWAEVLGRPRAKQPHSTFVRKR